MSVQEALCQAETFLLMATLVRFISQTGKDPVASVTELMHDLLAFDPGQEGVITGRQSH